MVDKNSDQNRPRRVSLQTGGRPSMGNKLEVVVGRERAGAALRCACLRESERLHDIILQVLARISSMYFGRHESLFVQQKNIYARTKIR